MYKRHPCCQIQWTFLSPYLNLLAIFDTNDTSFLLGTLSLSAFHLLDFPPSHWHSFSDLLILDNSMASALGSLISSIYAPSLGAIIQSHNFKY